MPKTETAEEKAARLAHAAELEEEREILEAHGLDPDDENTSHAVNVRLAASEIRALRHKRLEERSKKGKTKKSWWDEDLITQSGETQ